MKNTAKKPTTKAKKVTDTMVKKYLQLQAQLKELNAEANEIKKVLKAECKTKSYDSNNFLVSVSKSSQERVVSKGDFIEVLGYDYLVKNKLLQEITIEKVEINKK